MQLIRNLYDHFYEKARETRVTSLSIGLSYTAVTTDDGGMGIAYTYVNDKHCCSMNKDFRDYEGEWAIDLLDNIKSPLPLKRSMGLALINALNYHEASGLAEDAPDSEWMDSFAIGRETRVAMVGLFRPLMKVFKDRGALVEVLDDLQGVGERNSFYGKLAGWAEVLLLTSTSILNDSTEEMLSRLAPGVKVVMLGPSTPMVAGAFSHLPVKMLAGTVPVDQEAVMKAVRFGAGTPVIHRFSRKVHLPLV
ncbi:MAG: DUF364 domain-containing protein [Proteobacteria bacterium]|nr:DUF364 domain-containing protein [Pseudomonadota bacterium]MBU4297859.1 DUF364 domain-containing protein [Pseudomonadota bacterium]MCG2749852.1 DUF364 domain-containing protein [Desulfobulbaceae bacterium]